MEKACVRSVLLFGSQTWSISTGDLSHIKTSDHAMIQWIFGLKIKHIEDVLRWNRLQLSDHLC